MIDFLTLYIYQQTYIHMGNSTGTGRVSRFPSDDDPLGIKELKKLLIVLNDRNKKILKNLLYIGDRSKFETTKQEIANAISGWDKIIRDIQESNQLPVNDRGKSLSKEVLINLMDQSLTKASTLEYETSVKAVNEEISRKREEGEGTYDEVTDDIIHWLSENYRWVPEYRIKDEGVKNRMRDDGQNLQGYLNDRAFFEEREGTHDEGTDDIIQSLSDNYLF